MNIKHEHIVNMPDALGSKLVKVLELTDNSYVMEKWVAGNCHYRVITALQFIEAQSRPFKQD